MAPVAKVNVTWQAPGFGVAMARDMFEVEMGDAASTSVAEQGPDNPTLVTIADVDVHGRLNIAGRLWGQDCGHEAMEPHPAARATRPSIMADRETIASTG
jgi:hypothetical protein